MPHVVTPGGTIIYHRFEDLCKVGILIVTLLSLLPMYTWIKRNGRYISYEIFAFVPLCVAVNMILVGSNHLSTIFIALEIQSFFFYIGVASSDRSSQMRDAAINYFIQGALSSTLVLFGLAILYGETSFLTLKNPRCYCGQ